MSRIIPFSKCIARPNEGERVFYLKEHLEGVRNIARSFFPIELSSESRFLIELATICHDITKADADWQDYIHGRKLTGPNHSGSGAIIFSYLAYTVLKEMGVWDKWKLQLFWLLITRDIADHHGVLKGYVKNIEIEKGDFKKLDLQGIQQWIYLQFPQIKECNISFDVDSLDDWQYNSFEDFTEEIIDSIYDYHREEMLSADSMMEFLQQWRKLTSILIASDRFDISPVENPRFSKDDWTNIQEHIERYCQKGVKHPLAKIRSDAQQSVLEQWKINQISSFYVLEMPTGYGKTITALKLASEIGKSDGLSKIVYVAPYLSILEQNADSIRKSTEHLPMQHHSMAIVDKNILSENPDSDENIDLIIQSWANKIICTSFVQFMKAIFPKRAQETLRRIYLQNSIIIIDEPQIIDASVWNLFLNGLETICHIYNCRVIFCSATMPPFGYGLKNTPVRLSVSSKGKQERYKIHVLQEKMTAELCAERVQNLNEPTAAIIVNTIQDSINVFDSMSNTDFIEKYLLHGLMIPVHKSIQLKKIKEKMHFQGQKKIRVIATQILEAGVDLSFHYMFRALPILPSLIQSAGRVNRHGEKDIGIIETAKFVRNDKDTRFIYGKDLCRISDGLLFTKEIWYESEIEILVKQFYNQMFKENRYESVLQDIEKAFLGNWETLTQHEVFKNDSFHRLPIFIPFSLNKVKKYIPETLIDLMNNFQVSDAEEIYELFLAKDLRKNWSFQQKKQFQILFHQFIVNVPVNQAIKLVPKEDFLSKKVPKLEDGRYSIEKGLDISGIDDFII